MDEFDMPSLDAVRPRKGAPRKNPAPKSPETPPPSGPPRRHVGWLLIGVTASVVFILWVVLARANVIFPTANDRPPSSVGATFQRFFSGVRDLFRGGSSSNVNLEVRELEEKVFPQFTNQE